MKLFILPLLIIFCSFENEPFRTLTVILSLLSILINFEFILKKVYRYELFMFIYPIMTILSSFIWISLIDFNILVPVLKIPIIYFGSKSAIFSFKKKPSNVNFLQISTVIIIILSIFKIGQNYSAIINYDPIIQKDIGFEFISNYYLDILNITSAASLITLLSFNKKLLKLNKKIIFFGIIFFIVGLFSSVILATRFALFAFLCSLIIVGIKFWKKLIYKTQSSLKSILKIDKLNILNILPISLILSPVIFFSTLIFSFISTDSLARNIFLYKFVESISTDNSILSRVNLYTNFLSVNIFEQFSLLLFGLGAGSYNFIMNSPPHNLFIDILFNGGLISLICFFYFFYKILKKVSYQIYPYNILLFFYIFYIITISLLHDFGRISSFWIYLCIYANLFDESNLNNSKNSIYSNS